MRLKALIVDDEPIARGVLRDELEEVGSVEIVGEAENGAIALDLIRTRHPDVVFLDLQMPTMSGFEVVRHLGDGSHLPSVVIVTAYDQYAIEAFEAGAIDYLLKPVGQERLAQAVDRVRRTISRKPEVGLRDAGQRRPSKGSQTTSVFLRSRRERMSLILSPLLSTSGSSPKSCFKASPHGRGLGRGRFTCRRRAKIEVCATDRGANRSKFRPEC